MYFILSDFKHVGQLLLYIPTNWNINLKHNNSSFYGFFNCQFYFQYFISLINGIHTCSYCSFYELVHLNEKKSKYCLWCHNVVATIWYLFKKVFQDIWKKKISSFLYSLVSFSYSKKYFINDINIKQHITLN